MLRRAQLAIEPSPSVPVAAETLATLDLSDGLAIDNFEGLARHRGNRYFMVSDDNDLFVQRGGTIFSCTEGDGEGFRDGIPGTGYELPAQLNGCSRST